MDDVDVEKYINGDGKTVAVWCPYCKRQELQLPDKWQLALEEIEECVHGPSDRPSGPNMWDRFGETAVLAALEYLHFSQQWKAKNPGREDDWLDTEACASLMMTMPYEEEE